MTIDVGPVAVWSATERQAPNFSRPVVHTEWRVMAYYSTGIPYARAWQMAATFVAGVDPQTVGEIRLRTSLGDVSQVAKIVGHRVGPSVSGFTPVTDWGTDDELNFFVEGRKTSGPGGVRLHRSAVSLVYNVKFADVVYYPFGYDPGTEGPYPPDYDTDPYGE